MESGLVNEVSFAFTVATGAMSGNKTAFARHERDRSVKLKLVRALVVGKSGLLVTRMRLLCCLQLAGTPLSYEKRSSFGEGSYRGKGRSSQPPQLYHQGSGAAPWRQMRM